MARRNIEELRRTQQEAAELEDACSLILEAVRDRGNTNMFCAAPDLILNLKLYFGIELDRWEAREIVQKYLKVGPVYHTPLTDRRSKRKLRVKQTE